MGWFFGKQPKEEKRDASYTDTLINAVVSQARGDTLAIPTATAALEACAGTVGRAFAAAEVKARPIVKEALTPSFFEMIGRSLIRRGELLFSIDTTGGRLVLLPAEQVDVEGGPDPSTWWYRLTLGGPSRTLTYPYLPAESVIHCMYARDSERPWRGNGPLVVASLAGRLSAATVNALGDEAAGPRGRFLPLPVDGDDPTVATMNTTISNAKGGVAIVEGGDFDSVGQPSADYVTRRFGAEPPKGLVDLHMNASKEVYAACGLNAALWGAGDSAATREAWRLALFGVIAPLGKLVEQELRMKLEDDITISWQELRASDLSGRARAFQSLVGGGMDIEKAVAIAGLMIEGE